MVYGLKLNLISKEQGKILEHMIQMLIFKLNLMIKKLGIIKNLCLKFK